MSLIALLIPIGRDLLPSTTKPWVMVAPKLTMTVPLVVKLTLVRTKSESWRKLKSRRSSSSAGWLSSVGDLAKFWLISANWLVKVLTRSTALCRP